MGRKKKGGGKKKMKWNTTKLIAVGGLGAVTVVLSLFGAAINAISGISGLGGILNIFVFSMMAALCCLLIDKFGSATLMGLIFSICAIPVPVLGPPGFLPKILIGIAFGSSADMIYMLLKRNKKIAAIAIGIISAYVTLFLILWLGSLFSIPGIHESKETFLTLPVIFGGGIYAAFSGYVGYLVYTKLKDTAVVKRIRGKE